MIGISQSSEQRAIIDIGSNTVRLVVYSGPLRAPVVVLNEKVNAQLGKDMGRTGAISEKSMQAALASLERFATLLRLLDVENVKCVATAAARDASNGPMFLDAVRSFGLSPRLLTGEEEARASASGIIAAFPDAKGVVADLGGGSLELVEIDADTPDVILPGGITLPFGTLRLKDMRDLGQEKFSNAVLSGLKARGWDACNNRARGLPLYIVGGSWRALALQAIKLLNWPVDDPHGFELSASEAMRLSRLIAKGKISSANTRISNSRMNSLPDAAALMAQLVATLHPSRLIFSSWGLREGLLHRQLPKKVQQESPLLASVASFAQSTNINTDDALRVANWTAPVCADLNTHGHDLRKAATLLSLATMRTEPNMRKEEALNWALRKRWIGVDMAGRGIMAMTTFANSGETEALPELARLASKSELQRAVTWGLAIRLCRRLTGGTKRGMQETSISIDGKCLVLTLHNAARPLYVSSTAKDLKALSNWLGLSYRVQTDQGDVIDAKAFNKDA